MIARRRAARPTGPSTNVPSESGPRWTSVELMAAIRPGSTEPRADAIPQIPHMRHYSRSTGGQLRSTRTASAPDAPRLGGRALAARRPAAHPVSDPARPRRARARLRARGADGDAPARRGPLRDPAAAPLLGRVQHGTARPEAQPAPDLAARDRAGGVDDGGGRGRGSLRDRPVVADRVRARCRRLADRSDRGDVDRPQVRRPAARDRDRRGREPRQRRDRARPLQVRGCGRRHRLLLARHRGRGLRLDRPRRNRGRPRSSDAPFASSGTA